MTRVRPVDPPLFPMFARQNQTRTSRAAAAAVEPKAPTQRDLVLEDIRACKAWGTTQSAIVTRLRLPLQSVCARVNELGELGLVKALRKTRETNAGGAGLVFVAVEHVNARELEAWPARRGDLVARLDALEETVRRLEARWASLPKESDHGQDV